MQVTYVNQSSAHEARNKRGFSSQRAIITNMDEEFCVNHKVFHKMILKRKSSGSTLVASKSLYFFLEVLHSHLSVAA